MKKALTLLLFLLLIQRAFAQDSIPVSFHQETDTLVKQRFIDRYENVFMTKVPTRQMFKIAAVGSEIQGTGFNFGYEYKLLPSLSVEASVYTQLSPFNSGLAQELQHLNLKSVSIWGNAKARWYYNMNRRIEKGLNANNFSGSYFGLSFEQRLYDEHYSNTTRLGLLYGFQSRFLNRGYIDFSVGLFQKRSTGSSFSEGNPAFFKVKNFVLSTQANIGIAFGDWKKTATNPICDVIMCDESIKGQLKIEMPYIAIGFRDQVVRAGLSYERQFGQSPLSIQGGTDMYFANQNVNGALNSRYFSIGAALELRYYFLQRFLMRSGKGGNNLSGPYLGLRGGYEIFSAKISNHYSPEYNNSLTYKAVRTELHLGYQQRLFKTMYINGSINYGKQFLHGYHYTGASKPFLSSKMAIGFTF
ncbi:hypothetical protein [Dyadobacter psychrophilus]|uniref:Uncharacterized protein n=1 Tax=Dyadobacter psychrophilus TaxID=651661 RepID=A0A1T5G6N1_9BACT|nr:hypothetical protein [Dyadobacter psychrophilus]SKC03984.1 hypothetical protein SAMN05660293_03727 [Dyadobacter psychrophilus]